METYREILSIHKECEEILTRPTLNAITFHVRTLEQCYLILIPLYCKSAAISWMNDCENMKLVVSTDVVLLH